MWYIYPRLHINVCMHTLRQTSSTPVFLFLYTHTFMIHICAIHTYIHDTCIHDPYVHNTYIHIHTCIYESHFWTDTLLRFSLRHQNHVYMTQIYTYPMHIIHIFTFIHVYASIHKYIWNEIPMRFSLLLSPSLTDFVSVLPPPSLDWLVVSTPYICDATCDLCYRAHNIFVDLRSKMWYVRHIASYIAHMCHIGTANPTWGDIFGMLFQSSKLKARTSLFTVSVTFSPRMWSHDPPSKNMMRDCAM